MQQMDPIDAYSAAKQAEIALLKHEFASLQSLYFQLKPSGKPKAQLAVSEPSKSTISLDLSTEAGKTARLLEYISQEALTTLKELFITYATLQSYLMAERLELAQYHKLLIDCGLMEEGLTRVQADLLFCKRNQAKWISFWRFVEILTEFARIHYRCDSGASRLSDYLREVVFKAVPKRLLPLDTSTLDSQLTQHDVSLVLSLHSDELKALFQLYRNKDSKQGKGLLLPKFLTLLSEFHLVPELLSKPEAVRLFRAADPKQFAAASVDLEEFKRAMAFVGLFAFARPEAGPRQRAAPQECVAALFDWLRLSADQLRVLQLDRGRK